MNESHARHGYAERGYSERGYSEPGYAQRGYSEPGYAQRGYPEPGYAQRGFSQPEYARRGQQTTRAGGQQTTRAGGQQTTRAGGQQTTRAGGQQSTRAGGVILTALSLLSTLLVILGLYYATGTGERHKVALAAAGCEPNLLSTDVGCTTVQMLTSQYNKIANPAIEQLNADVADYKASEMHNLTAAEAALRAEVTLEDGFDSSLAAIPFSPFVAPTAKTLIRDIQAQAKLTAQQAQSSSLSQMRSFNGRVQVASAAVRTELGLLSKAVKAPVTPSQEP
jgi:hypothetical protein